MISIKRFCLCCFPLTDDNRPETNTHNLPIGSSIDNTNSENLNQTIKGRSLLKPSDFPVLKLVILDSQTFEIGSEFSVNQLGLESSSHSKSGSVTIGSSSETNDIVISEQEKGIGSNHLLIKFDRTFSKGFALKDLGQGSGTFIRIEKKLFLKHNQIISFGNSHMNIHFNHDPSCIELLFIDGPRKGETFNFNVSDCPINFGRMNDCSIKFDDQNLSRYQCFISFDQRWFIQDGDGNKCSTNGTWMFGEDFVEISNGMVFKVAETLVKVVNMQVILDYEEL